MICKIVFELSEMNGQDTEEDIKICNLQQLRLD